VGGSTGHASIALARRYSELTFIVEDLPEVVEEGPKYLASQDDGYTLESRVSYKAHNFFDPQPVRDADVYLLRMILHDWAFADSVRILTHLAEALKPGARIIIMDTVLPDPGSIPVSKERLLRVRDLTMMQVFNSQERHLEDWKEIFSKVPRGLKVEQVKQPAGSVLSLIVLVVP
jgi:6-hydroxytryprostatin B O-methyltransferase